MIITNLIILNMILTTLTMMKHDINEIKANSYVRNI